MILAYHEVLPQESAYRYSVTCKQLDLHMSVVDEFCGVSVRGLSQPAVTFDDGHLSNYQYALPILLARRLRGTFFVTTAWIGRRQGFMTWEQLREISSLGHIVQSHGLSHLFLTHCSPKDLVEEVQSSKKAIEDALGRRVYALSVPGGRWNSRVLRACFQSGYKDVYVSGPTICRAKEGIRLHGRLMVTNSMTEDVIRPYLLGKMSALVPLIGKHVCQSVCKRLLGDGIYGWLWKRMAAKEQASYQ
jgi:hypothetical protein